MQREDAGKVFLLIFLLIVAVFAMAFINADIAVADVTTALKSQFDSVPTGVFWFGGAAAVIQVFLLSKVDLEH